MKTNANFFSVIKQFVTFWSQTRKPQRAQPRQNREMLKQFISKPEIGCSLRIKLSEKY